MVYLPKNLKKTPTQDAVIRRAIKSGEIPKDLESWKTKPINELTPGQKCCRFALEHLKIPEGKDVGKPLVLDAYQVAFILAVVDNPHGTRKAILSIARRNGKTFVVAVILLNAILGVLAVQNSVVASAAMSREQASLCFRLMCLMLQASPGLQGLYKIVPSSKKIIGLKRNVEYMALSADAKTGHGKSIRMLLLDEAGQISESENEYVSMLRTSQGSYEDSLFLIISTQAPSDSSFLSLEIDSSLRENEPKTITHVYAADPECDVMDEKQWYYSNPGLGKYRSVTDLREQIKDAIALPAKMPGVMNLLLNMRVNLESVLISPEVWKANSDLPDINVFRNAEKVTMGLDLAVVNDLSCAVISAVDDLSHIHVMCFAFSPLGGIRERSLRDRVPYDEWARTGVIYAPPGATLDYDLICQHLRVKLDEMAIRIDEVIFDRYRIDIFKAAAQRNGFGQSAIFTECGQGFVSMAPRIDALETSLLKNMIKHGSSPILNLGAASAIVELDNVGNRRLTKKKSSQKIDGIIAMLMAIYPHVAQTGAENQFSIDAFA
jgi:phage terminase large subunit-like protein